MPADDRNPCCEVQDQDPFCQGDVLHRHAGSDGGLGDFAMIVTADCDIAQGKDGGEFSLLKLTTAENYIERTWAKNEVRKIADRQLRLALDVLNDTLKKLDPCLTVLNADSLREWLEDQKPEDIADAVGLTGGKRIDAVKALQCVRCASEETEAGLTNLKRLWAILEMKDKAIQSRLSDTLHPSRGAADAYFIPYLPQFSEIGFVINLRALVSVPRQRVFASRTDARIAGASDGYYRLCRFRDGVKYSVVHQMVNLFSRVGMSEEYESESTSAADMVLHSVYSKMKEMA